MNPDEKDLIGAHGSIKISFFTIGRQNQPAERCRE